MTKQVNMSMKEPEEEGESFITYLCPNEGMLISLIDFGN